MKLSRFTSNVDLTVGFMYLQNDINSTAGGRPGYLLGWYAVPQYDFTKHFSAIADFTNFYNWHAHTGENVHGFAGGIVYRYALPRLRLTPFTFAEAGGGRDSYQRTVSWSPQLIGGVGANFQLTKRLSLQLIPALFVNTQLGNGNWQTSYAPKAGITFDLGSLRRH